MPQWGEERDRGRGVEAKGEEPRKEGDKEGRKELNRRGKRQGWRSKGAREGSRSRLPWINLELHCRGCKRGVWLLSVAEACILSSLWRRKGGVRGTLCPITGPLPYPPDPNPSPHPCLVMNGGTRWKWSLLVSFGSGWEAGRDKLSIKKRKSVLQSPMYASQRGLLAQNRWGDDKNPAGAGPEDFRSACEPPVRANNLSEMLERPNIPPNIKI